MKTRPDSPQAFAFTPAWLIRVAGLTSLFASAVAQWSWGRPISLSWIAPWDDEGYSLILLKQSSQGFALYDEMFSGLGPVWHWIWNLIFGTLHLNYDLTTGRLVTLACWVLASLIVASATVMLSRSWLAGFLVQWVSYVILTTLAREPMHPMGLISVILGCLLWVLIIPIRNQYRWVMLGGLCTLLAFIKINFGALLAIALVLSLLPRVQQIRSRPWILVLCSVILIAPALVLVRSNLPLAAVCGVSVTLAVWSIYRLPQLPPPDLVRVARALSIGGLGALLLVVIVAWLRGTSPMGLWGGVVGRPMALPDVFTLTFYTPPTVAVTLVVGLLFALALLARPSSVPSGETQLALGGLGLGMAATVGFIAFAPLAWLFNARSVAHAPYRSAPELPVIAVLIFLTVFPVSGSQVSVASLLLLPTLAVVVVSGISVVAKGLPSQLWRRVFVGVAACGLSLATGLYLWNQKLEIYALGVPEIVDAHSRFDSMTAVELPEATGLRIPTEDATTFRDNTVWIKDHCDTFYSLPGLPSYYILTDLPVPGRAAAGVWWTYLTVEEQERVIRDMEAAARPCFLRHNALTNFWLQGRAMQSGPLLDYLTTNYVPAAHFNSIELLQRKARWGRQ